MKTKQLRIYLSIETLLLVLFGAFMIYSASCIWAEAKFADAFYYLKRQLLFIGLGGIAFFVGYQIPSEKLKKYAPHFLLFTTILLILVLIPGIGLKRNGSRSWFGIGSFSFQPAELYKIAIVLYVASFLEKHFEESKSLRSLLPLFLWNILGFTLILLEPDFGTAVVTLGGVILTLFVSRLNIRYYVYIGILLLAGFVVLILAAPYRFERITSFLNPWNDPLGSGFQSIQSLFAIAPGALMGEGILTSTQKYFYLPEPQTDFIFAVVVEEFGLVGGLLLIALFLSFFLFGFHRARICHDLFDSLLIIGLFSFIFIQVVINLGVVVGLLPVTGITLPFISYGGSSLTISLFSMGLIVGRKS